MHERALPLHRRALALREALDPPAPELAVHLNELALWHANQGEFDAAAALFARARALLERQHGAASLEVARVLLSQAAANEAQARYGQAEALYDGTAAARLDEAQALNNLAGLHYRRRRFAEAETQYLRALALHEQAHGADSPGLLPVLENLLALYRSQRRDADARAVARRAEALRERLHAESGG
ncbi:tetratricopeptide repeat protein [Thauera linaloolentis]|uniref:tetratricopeptide repeat protein n=1 Tax=Thauera linaloolentis TaxID=76112 RepID=UPI003312FD08